MHSDSFPPISSCTRTRHTRCAPSSRTGPPAPPLTLHADPLPRRHPPRPRLGAMRPPAPPCRSGWRRGPGCAAPSGPPCDVPASRTAWSVPGRLQAPALRASFVRCFFWDLSWCVVAAAVSWAAGLSLQVVRPGGRRRRRKGRAPTASKPVQAPPCRRRAVRPAGPVV